MRDNIQTAIRLIYPSRCISCGDLVEGDFGLCGTCWRDTPFVSGVVCNKCGTPLPGPADDAPITCDACMKSPRIWDEGRTTLLYRENARRLVLQLKHGDRQELARPAGRWMANSARSLVRENMIVAPVPLHWSRLLKRRYNQAALLGREVAVIMGLAYCPDLLIRPKVRGNMDGLSVEERFAKMRDAIRPHSKRAVKMAARPVLLVDDVMTSGATLDSAARACFDAGAAEVNVLTLARVAKDA